MVGEIVQISGQFPGIIKDQELIRGTVELVRGADLWFPDNGTT